MACQTSQIPLGKVCVCAALTPSVIRRISKRTFVFRATHLKAHSQRMKCIEDVELRGTEPACNNATLRRCELEKETYMYHGIKNFSAHSPSFFRSTSANFPHFQRAVAKNVSASSPLPPVTPVTPVSLRASALSASLGHPFIPRFFANMARRLLAGRTTRVATSYFQTRRRLGNTCQLAWFSLGDPSVLERRPLLINKTGADPVGGGSRRVSGAKILSQVLAKAGQETGG